MMHPVPTWSELSVGLAKMTLPSQAKGFERDKQVRTRWIGPYTDKLILECGALFGIPTSHLSRSYLQKGCLQLQRVTGP